MIVRSAPKLAYASVKKNFVYTKDMNSKLRSLDDQSYYMLVDHSSN